MAGTSETYADLKKCPMNEMHSIEDLKRITAFVKDWSSLDRSDRIDVISKNINAFGQDKNIWLTAVSDE